jgi:Rrf2 family protein
MKLSTKGRYAARLMLDLALRYGQGPVLLKDVAQRQEISEKYLGHLIPPLKAAGLINSSRGAHGGYVLAKAPEAITLAEVVLAVEGDLALVECVSTPAVCHRVDSCVTRDIWGRVSEKMMGVLQSTTLLDMVKQQRKRQRLQPLMYSI